MITIYYGMSGALKATTIENAPRHKDDLKIWSDIKPYWNYRKTLFPSELPGTDGDFIIQRLLQIQDMKRLSKSGSLCIYNWVIERGVSDMIKCMIDNGTFDESNQEYIYHIINEEYNLLDELGFGKPQKILLVMLDKNFIQDKVLNEPNRKRYYPDLETYLKKQEEYVNFTKQYNDISEVIEIRDAYNYIDNLKHFIY
jgi:hypothetical protein